MNAKATAHLEAAIKELQAQADKLHADAMEIIAMNETYGEIRYANGAQKKLHDRTELRSQIKAIEAVLVGA